MCNSSTELKDHKYMNLRKKIRSTLKHKENRLTTFKHSLNQKAASLEKQETQKLKH